MDAPVSVVRRGSDVDIEFNLRFTGKYSALPFPGSGCTYAEAAAAGIIGRWSGAYDLAGLASAPGGGYVPARPADIVRARVRVRSPAESPSGVLQKPRRGARFAEVRIEDRRGSQTEHVFTALNGPLDVFSLPRNLADALRSGQLERVLYNWSLENPGTVHLYPCGTLEDQKAAAAHEAGHLLGIGDAYGSGLYRLGEDCPAYVRDTNFAGQSVIYPVAGDDMMRSNGCVSPYDVVLALRAHATGKPQFFPKGDDSTTREIMAHGLCAVIGYIRQGKIRLN